MMEDSKKVQIKLIKLINGHDICTAVFKEDDGITIVYPVEIFFENQFNDIDDFEMTDFLAGSLDKVVRLPSDRFFFMTDPRDDIFDVYLDYINKQDNISFTSDLPQERESLDNIDTKVVDLFSRK